MKTPINLSKILARLMATIKLIYNVHLIYLQLWVLFAVFPNFSDMQAIVEVDSQLLQKKMKSLRYNSLLTGKA